LIDLLGLLITNQWSVLVLIDMITGAFSRTPYGWGIPLGLGTIGTTTYNWTGAWILLYASEWLCWFLIPPVTMLWWRSWANKHPELVEEL